MTHAVGIGFDWLFSYLSPADSATISAGVLRLGLSEALKDYARGEFWTNCTFNWGVVTNGGLTVGALAFVDQPGRLGADASAVVTAAARGLHCPFSSFAPDGGWHEGFMYWQYVAEYAQAVTESLIGVSVHRPQPAMFLKCRIPATTANTNISVYGAGGARPPRSATSDLPFNFSARGIIGTATITGLRTSLATMRLQCSACT